MTKLEIFGNIVFVAAVMFVGYCLWSFRDVLFGINFH